MKHNNKVLMSDITLPIQKVKDFCLKKANKPQEWVQQQAWRISEIHPLLIKIKITTDNCFNFMLCVLDGSTVSRLTVMESHQTHEKRNSGLLQHGWFLLPSQTRRLSQQRQREPGKTTHSWASFTGSISWTFQNFKLHLKNQTPRIFSYMVLLLLFLLKNWSLFILFMVSPLPSYILQLPSSPGICDHSEDLLDYSDQLVKLVIEHLGILNYVPKRWEDKILSFLAQASSTH